MDIKMYFRYSSGAIDRVPHRAGKTKIGRALEHTLNQELIRSRGDRPNVDTIVIVFTDGRSADDPGRVADQMRSIGHKVFAVGITNQIDQSQLRAIGGKGKNVFRVKNFQKLNRRLKNSITSHICGKRIA